MEKNAQYRRAVWMGEPEHNLAGLVEQCLIFFGEEGIPRFAIAGSTECLIARRSLADGRRYLHFVVFETGAPVAIIRTLAQGGAEEVEATEQNPDGGQEYIQQQLFCLIENNHVIWTAHNNTLREKAIQAIFVCMIHAAGLTTDVSTTQFMFQIVLDEDKVQELFNGGIQEIDLGLGAFRPTLERIAAGGALPEDGFLGMVAGLFSEIPSAENLHAAERIEGKLVLRPGRNWDNPEVIDLLSTMSNNIRNGVEDEFTIVTKSGFRLTREKMSFQRTFQVDGNKRILSSYQVDAAFREVFQSLREDGILDA
ncbi:hypothetical protein [Neorhizobium sp. DAR64872/K0K18]|uniref:hypothetical protein n=1 Tax=Neorhizobium sp. DAR64872/K0K18 TaxID=3421958 RepID=UPI003D29E96B